jgi:starch synthase
MSGTRILYVTSEIEPFLKISDVADFVRKLPQAMQEKGMEIRILMPRFGVINERKNRLHEVVRLSGINIPVGNEEHPLIIKVASIPSAKLQVYFIDNEDFFKRKTIFHDKNDKFHEDNDERAIFFCKGVLETIKKLGWSPDIIHCNDWMTGLIPLYLKTIYKDEPMFKDSKVVFSVYDNSFKADFAANMSDKLISSEIEASQVSGLLDAYAGMIKLGASHSDAVLDGTSDTSLLKTMLNGSSSKMTTMPVNDDMVAEDYFDFYLALLDKK